MLNALNDSWITVKVMNYPIGIDEISHRSDSGRGARGDEAIGVKVRYQRVSVNQLFPSSCGRPKGLDVSGRKRFGDAYEHLIALTKWDPVEQIKASAMHARAYGIFLDSGFFGPSHVPDGIAVSRSQSLQAELEKAGPCPSI
jgi:hypothetical protein